jgi:hypothetical protein
VPPQEEEEEEEEEGTDATGAVRDFVLLSITRLCLALYHTYHLSLSLTVRHTNRSSRG